MYINKKISEGEGGRRGRRAGDQITNKIGISSQFGFGDS